MSAPVTADDIVSGAVTRLRGIPEAVAAVSTFIIGGVPTAGIFQYRLWAKVEGEGGTCAVLSSDGGWAAANMHNTLRFPRLTLNIWADPIRDDINNVVDPGEVMRRSFATFKVFDKYLHLAGEAEVTWGQLRVISCVRLTEPTTIVVPDGDGLVRCQVNYAVTEG